MKTKLFWNWKTALVLAGVPLVVATFQNPSPGVGGEPEGPTSAVAAASVPSSNLPAGAELTATTNVLQPALPTLPNMKLPTPVAEVAKLAQAGVSEQVILAYITNSRATFRADADQIVYLNDLGVSGAVIAAMVEHDAALAGATAANLPATLSVPVSTIPEQTATGYPTEATATAVVPAPQYVSYDPGAYSTVDDAAFFYDSLSPYGSWVNVSGYGLCWQPTVYARNRDWRPYFDRGRWLYTDCGWYWQSDYSWGWATFHYGRWFCDVNRGWVWRPNRVWGPAWVSWRNTTDYCGWAPLPPAAHFAPGIGFTFGNRPVATGFDFGISAGLYTFIPVDRFCDYSPGRYCVTGPNSTQVFNQSTVINNVTVENRRVFNRGIDPRRVEAASRTPVRRAIVDETPHRDGDHRVRAERIERRGNDPVVSRPDLPQPAGRSNGPRQADAGGGRRGNRSSDNVVLTPPASVTPVAPENQDTITESRPRVQTISRRGVTPRNTTPPVATPPPVTSPAVAPPVAAPAPTPVATQVPPARGSRGDTAPNPETRSIRSLISNIRQNARDAASPAPAPAPVAPVVNQLSPTSGGSTVQLPPRENRRTEPSQVNTTVPSARASQPNRSFSFTVNRPYTPTPPTTYQQPAVSTVPATQTPESTRPRIGGSRGFGNQATRNENVTTSPAQSQPQTLVPTRGNGGISVGNFSRPNSAPSQSSAAPQTPRSESLRLPPRQIQSAPAMPAPAISAPSRPSAAPSFAPPAARRVETPSPARQQQSAPVLTPSRSSSAPSQSPAASPSRPSSSPQSEGRSGRR